MLSHFWWALICSENWLCTVLFEVKSGPLRVHRGSRTNETTVLVLQWNRKGIVKEINPWIFLLAGKTSQAYNWLHLASSLGLGPQYSGKVPMYLCWGTMDTCYRSLFCMQKKNNRVQEWLNHFNVHFCHIRKFIDLSKVNKKVLSAT